LRYPGLGQEHGAEGREGRGERLGAGCSNRAGVQGERLGHLSRDLHGAAEHRADDGEHIRCNLRDERGYGNNFTTTTYLWISVVGNVIAAVLIPFVGNLTDRIGRRPCMIVGALGSAQWALVPSTSGANGHRLFPPRHPGRRPTTMTPPPTGPSRSWSATSVRREL